MDGLKIVLVTGCAKGGIGYEYCKAFSEQNCHVIASDVPQRVDDMLDIQSKNIETLELDVSSDESVSSAVKLLYPRSYCASKAAVHAMSNTLRVELKPFGINVVLVVPGAIRSNFGRATSEKLANYDWKLYKDFKEAIAES
ncbi:hypothetical protein GH714_015945 [Hevea brasiliensis]|uniref:Uncharacterized protein n=1 Tax=Hevea brasiliensis TaxID=3981 RepID=A0A6A6K5V8_HEVBR|nr:hypothetical protein GH714_015945 [Hevea brasiliensis]